MSDNTVAKEGRIAAVQRMHIYINDINMHAYSEYNAKREEKVNSHYGFFIINVPVFKFICLITMGSCYFWPNIEFLYDKFIQFIFNTNN